MTTNGRTRVVVVGAGVAGLVAARILSAHGHAVVIFDKGRGPGGRASTRRRAGFAFDHGAQYFTARDERFRRSVDQWLDDGVAAPWTPPLVVFETDGVRPSGGKHERFVGVPGMDQIGKHLARDLDVRRQVRVARLERDGAQWQVTSDDGTVLAMADVALVTLPPAQAVPLLAAAPALAVQAGQAVMRPCWAVLLGVSERLPVDFAGAFVNAGPLAWVARNSSKPGREGGEAWVLHASMAWSEGHLEESAAAIIDALCGEFARRCVGQALPAISFVDAHRWRYAQPDPPLETSCLFDADLRIGAAGDWCGGPKIQGAFLSGTALADRVLRDPGGRVVDEGEAGG